MSRDQAVAALAAAGFELGTVREQPDSTVAPGTVVGPTAPRHAALSTKIDFVVSRAGTAPQTQLVFSVASSKTVTLHKRTTIAARVKVSRPATLTAMLSTAGKKRLYTWRVRHLKAGANVVKLTLPKQIRRPGNYTLTWVARSGSETVSRTVKLKLVGKKVAQIKTNRSEVEVVLAGEQHPKTVVQSALAGSRAHVVAQAGLDQTFALAASGSRDIQIVVVDVDLHGVGFVSDLRTVFPVDPRDRHRDSAGRSRPRAPRRCCESAPAQDDVDSARQGHRHDLFELDDGLHGEDRADEDQDSPEHDPKHVLVESPRRSGAEPAARYRTGQAGEEDVPVDAAFASVRREPGQAEEKADDEVGSSGSLHVHADEAQQRRHPECSEDDAHRPAEGTDAETARGGRPETETLARHRADGPQRQVDATPDEYGRNRNIEQALGSIVGDERTRDRADDRRRSHPRNDPPVDPPGARMVHRPGGRRSGGDRDIRPRGGDRIAADRDDERQPQRPEHEPEHRTHVAGHERAGEGGDELPAHGRPSRSWRVARGA